MIGRPRVLVIDDSTTTCLFIASKLEEAGYFVNVALNGQDGLTKIATFRTAQLSFSPTLVQNERPTLFEFVPRRVIDHDAMRARNPFAHSPIIEEKQARQLYDAIDRKRTLSQIASVTGLETNAITFTLRELLKKNCTQMYDATGKLMESTL